MISKKKLRLSFILQGIYLLLCLLFIINMTIYDYVSQSFQNFILWTSLGYLMILVFCPVPVVCVVLNLSYWSREKENLKAKHRSLLMWVRMFLPLVISFFSFVVTVSVWVTHTGGV